MAQSDRVIKCGICLTYFTEPKILPCFHTFCLKCLETNAQTNGRSGQFPCPVCRTPITIPDGGVGSFQSNFYIQARDSRDSELDCDACGKSETAKYKCNQCDQNFCANCAEIHVRMSSSRGHDLVSISPEEGKRYKLDDSIMHCMEHPSEEITTICKDCDELVCRVCKITLHMEHSCNTISAETADRKKQLRDLIDTAERNLNESEKDLHVVSRQAESKHNYFNEQITHLRKRRDVLISNINKKFNSFEGKIKQLNDEQRMLSNEITEDLKLRTESFKQTIVTSEEMVDLSKDINLLRNFNSLVQKLREIEVSSTPAVSGHELMETVDMCTSWLIKLNEQNGDM